MGLQIDDLVERKQIFVGIPKLAAKWPGPESFPQNSQTPCIRLFLYSSTERGWTDLVRAEKIKFASLKFLNVL